MRAIATYVVGVGAAAFAAATASAGPLQVGRPAPAFRLRKLGGGELSLRDLRGKVVLLAFWMPDCPPCASEAPQLQALYRKYWGAGLRVVGVAPFSAGVTPLHRFIGAHGITYPTVVDALDKTARRYGVGRYPVTVLIDRQGMVRWRNRGFQRGDAAVLAQQIARLIHQRRDR